MDHEMQLNGLIDGFATLEQGVHAALETYSNVHRGSGHNSIVSTHLFEQAREIVLEYLGVQKSRYIVIFLTPARAAFFIGQLEPGSYQMLSSSDIGLPLGVKALAVKKRALPKGVPFQSGGGTTKLVSKKWVMWADAPDKYEAGTPAIINIITFAIALRLMQRHGKDIFTYPVTEKSTATEILYHDELEKYSGQELMIELRKTLIGRGIMVPTVEGPAPLLHLDNSASTPTFAPVWNAVRQTWRQPDQTKHEIVQQGKNICAGFLNAPPSEYDIIFTSNTTEAINVSAGSICRESLSDKEPVILNTLLEHSSNELPWRMLPGHTLIRLAVDGDGFVDLHELEKILSDYNQNEQHGRKRILLVAVSGASNVLGLCNNIKEISRIVHNYGARLLVDAAQLAAHRKIDMKDCDIDYLAFSAHKVYAPFGCGVLAYRKGLLQYKQDELQLIRESGEENVGGIAALGKALVLFERVGFNVIQEEEQRLTAKVLRGLNQIKNLRIFGIKDPDAPEFARKLGVIAFDIKDTRPDKIAKRLALQRGISVRYGCQCAHLIIKHILKIPPFLEQVQRLIQTLFPKFRFLGVIRVSMGIGNSEEDADALILTLDKILGQSGPSTNANASTKAEEISGLMRKDIQQEMNDFIRNRADIVYL